MNTTTATPAFADYAWTDAPVRRAPAPHAGTWHPPIVMLGVPFDNVTTQQALKRIEEMVESRRPHYLATANVDFAVQALHDEELRHILLDAHMVVCDGMPLVWASKWLGNPLRERVAGSDLVPMLLQIAERKGYRVFFLGGSREVAQRAAANAAAKHPLLQIAGVHSPPFAPLQEMDHPAICRRIRESGADLLFVSFGCPKQEKWISMNYRSCGVPVTVGVGATIDFLAGTMKRAPRWMQVTGLEWIFRLAQEPRRLFKRYATDLAIFGTEIVRQAWQMRQRRAAAQPLSPERLTAKADVLTLPERLDAAEVRDRETTWQFWLDHTGPLVLDASGVTFVDSTGVGLLVRLRRNARNRNLPLVVAAASDVFKRTLSLMRLDGAFTFADDIESARAEISEAQTRRPTGLESVNFDAVSSMAWQNEITATEVDEVWRRTEILLAGSELHGGSSIVIDLARVKIIDSAGIGLMIRVKKHARFRLLDVRFANATPRIRELLRVVKLEDYLLDSTAPCT